jgi:hypothetical protein
MNVFRIVFVLTVAMPVSFCGAQTATDSGPAASNAANPSASFTPATPSDILQRSIGEVKQITGGIKLEKWKRGTVRDEAGNSIDAIQRDLQGSLPSLLKDADAAPSTLSKVLPLARNVDALYDVLVHLVEGARVSAPGDEVGQLQQAMADLEKGRVALGSQIQQVAAVQEKQIVDLRTTVQKQEVSLRAAATPQPAPKCPAPPTPKKKKVTKPAAGTATTTPASGSSNQPAKPQ